MCYRTLYHICAQITKLILVYAKCALNQTCRKMYLQINCLPKVVVIQNTYTKLKHLFVQRLISLVCSCSYGEAEKDCSLALALDDSYIKAYYRRATARVKLGKLEDAKLGTPNDIPTYGWCYGTIILLDYESILRLEPGNKQAKAELEGVRTFIHGLRTYMQ